MANLEPFNTFNFECVTCCDGEYTDIEFTDNSPKAIRRLWTLTYDSDHDHWYATLRRSETDDGDLDFVTPELPEKIVRALRQVFMASLINH